MDRRAKKLEKKRKDRAVAKKKTQVQLQRRAAVDRELLRTAASAPFGPCWVSEGWDNLSHPELVSVVVTRQLSESRYLPIVVLVDRTCLGVKDAYDRGVCTAREVEAFVDEISDLHGGMHPCEPLVAQSIVFHAIDYAAKLGFELTADFPAALFGSRPDQLLDTPWHAPAKPQYIAGPHDDVSDVLHKLREAGVEQDDGVIDTHGETAEQGA
jgi:hypothetical protein